MEPRLYVVRSTCRSCESAELDLILARPELPLASRLLDAAELDLDAARYPLHLAICRACSLVQALETVPPIFVFDERYAVFSSASQFVAAQAAELAEELIRERRLDRESLVIEIGSNDGYLLRHFLRQHIPVLGIEPAPAPSEAGRKRGIPTLPTFFTHELARRLREEGRRADVIVAADVLSRAPDPHGFLRGLRLLLKDDGIAVVDVRYVRNIVEAAGFDEVQNEQLCYFSVSSLAALLASEQLYVQDVRFLPLRGSTLRVVVALEPAPTDAVAEVAEEERELGMTGPGYYRNLARCAEALKLRLLALLGEIKAEGNHVVGLGATSEGTALLNYCGIDERFLDYVVDVDSRKQGSFLPGVHLPVLPIERLTSNRVDYALVLDAGLRLLGRAAEPGFRGSGGKFILPLPRPAVL